MATSPGGRKDDPDVGFGDTIIAAGRAVGKFFPAWSGRAADAKKVLVAEKLKRTVGPPEVVGDVAFPSARGVGAATPRCADAAEDVAFGR